MHREGDDCWYHKSRDPFHVSKLVDSDGKLVPCDHEEAKWVTGPTFGDREDDWKRLDETPSEENPDWEANIAYN